ncbi:NAD(P)/FAD-dependent oxidoreductase [Candidatus Villigracilis saccharophilus]|uniref:phytoene desaturase family protein n=1 Tax=Candidatus Villigracilis saccharophilus TaxID=3140684 RepID=UPI00313671FE|nr:NAD(P)/FAD-dependent oxidoreductase [Anaerolineales bacterium]
MEKFDIVIIGAGLGGLSAAGYLAKAGKKVLVLEHHTVPGGYAHEFRRGKYRFEVALHALDGAAPGGWSYPILKDLEVFDQVHFHRIDPFYTVQFSKQKIVAYADLMMYESEMVKHFPHERDGIHKIIADMVETYWQVRRFDAEGQLGIRPPLEKMPALYPNMMSAMNISLDEYMSKFLQDSELKTAFTTLWGYYGLPPEKLNAAIFIFPWVSYHLMGAYYPEGGSMAMSRALEATLKKYGGEVRYKQTVNKIEIKDGRAVAVVTEKGLRVEADVIISNANSPDTLLKFVGREHLPADYVRGIEEAKPSISNFVLYLGLDRDLQAEGFTDHEMFVVDGYDSNASYQAALDGDFARTGLSITNYSIADRGSAPEGGTVLNIFSLADWNSDNQWGTGGNLENYSDNPQYNELKKAATEILLDRTEKLIPGLRKSIKYIEVGTPITNWRYSRNIGGAIYGTDQTVDNSYGARLNAKTPIKNLFLTGAWTFGGGMSAALLSGRDTSRMVIGYMDGTPVILMTAPNMDENETPLPTPPTVAPVKQAVTSTSTSSTSVPTVTFKAAGSGRQVTLNSIGRRSVLLFHTADTSEDAERINKAVRAVDEYQACTSITIANVVDLHSVPKLFRSFAEKSMRDSFDKASKSIPQGQDPQDYVIILPDWDGKTTKGFGLGDTSKIVGLAVLDEQGGVVGTYQGNEPERHALELLSKV